MWRLPQMGNLRLGKTGVINLVNGEHKTQTRFSAFKCRPSFSSHLLVSEGQTRAFWGNMIFVLQHLFFPCINPPALRVPPCTNAPVNHRNWHKRRSHQRPPLVLQLQWLTLCSMIPLRFRFIADFIKGYMTPWLRASVPFPHILLRSIWKDKFRTLFSLTVLNIHMKST